MKFFPDGIDIKRDLQSQYRTRWIDESNKESKGNLIIWPFCISGKELYFSCKHATGFHV